MRTLHDLLTDPAHGLVREARPAQLTMATSVDEVLRGGGTYVVEAPVGSGKTFAYLLPALLAEGKRVVVATAKKALQDQILEKDYPALVRALGPDLPPMRGLPLKGKSNYTCSRAAEALLATHPADEATYAQFLTRSAFGDRADYPGAPPRWWSAATADGCIHRRCDRYNDCGYARLKRELAQARLVVVNHHLLGAEMALGHGTLVGPYDVLIVDEAHALADGIRAAFTYRVAEDSLTQLTEALKRVTSDTAAARRLLEPWAAMFADAPNQHLAEPEGCAWPVFPEGIAAEVLEGLEGIVKDLGKLQRLYQGDPEEGDEAPDDAGEGLGLDGAIEIDLAQEAPALEASAGQALALITQAQRTAAGLVRGLATAQGRVAPDPTHDDVERQEQRRVRVLENTAIYTARDGRGRYGVECAPINVGGIARAYLKAAKTVVLCSATLAVDGDFEPITRMIGVTPTKTEILPSSFAYDRQGFVFIPRDLPVVSRGDKETYAAVMARRVATACDLVRLSGGGAFVLTTANDELDAFATALRAQFPGRVFAQGHRRTPWDGDAPTALAKFRATPDAVLVGSKSFWEGVDVPGRALRLVILAKLPFPQAQDPIIKARQRLAGASAFNDVNLVDMLIGLRQGVGRLIRSRQDRGCVAILDSRIWSKAYGGMVRRALPWSNQLVTSNFAHCVQLLPRYRAQP